MGECVRRLEAVQHARLFPLLTKGYTFPLLLTSLCVGNYLVIMAYYWLFILRTLFTRRKMTGMLWHLNIDWVYCRSWYTFRFKDCVGVWEQVVDGEECGARGIKRKKPELVIIYNSVIMGWTKKNTVPKNESLFCVWIMQRFVNSGGV